MAILADKELEIIKRGVFEIVPMELLVQKLLRAKKEKRPLIVKLGADPSSADLHLGHTVVFRKLLDLQELGHSIVFIIGDFTAMIGDPTGKSKTRKPLSEQEVKENADTYQRQIFKVLDKDKTKVVFNSQWNKTLSFNEIINLTSKVTVARILERDDFSKRYKRGDSITLTEFLYSLIQAYDSVVLKSDIEIGGTDQKFNLLMGRQLQKDFGVSKEGQVCIMMPILEGLDGKNKMSKSLLNYVALNDSPSDMFGKLMSIPDVLIIKYLTLLTSIEQQKIKSYEEAITSGGTNPRDIKIILAHEIVKMYHSEEDADATELNFKRVFSKKELPDDIPSYETSDKEMWIVSFLSAAKLSSSNSEARRLIKSGAVSVNGKKIKDDTLSLKLEDGMVIKAGKRRFIKILLTS